METSLFKTLSEETNQKILLKLSEKPYTVTELFKELKEIKYRESIFKALEKMRKQKLVSKKYVATLRGYKYKTSFSRIVINNKLKVKID